MEYSIYLLDITLSFLSTLIYGDLFMKLYFLIVLTCFFSLKAMDTDKQIAGLSEPIQEVIGYYLHNIEDMDKERLQSRAKAIGLRIQDLVDQEQVCKDVISLGHLIDGRLRFRLVDFFATSERSKLSAVNKLKLMCDFINIEEKDERKKGTIGTIYSLLSDNMLAFDSYQQVESVLQKLDAQNRERMRKHFYTVSEFKRLHENYKVDVSKWSLERCLYFFELITIIKHDKAACDFFNSLQPEISRAKEQGVALSFDQKKKDTMVSMHRVAQNTETRLKKLGIPHNILSEKMESVIMMLGILHEDRKPVQERNYAIEAIKNNGQELLKEFKISYGLGIEAQMQHIFRNCPGRESVN